LAVGLTQLGNKVGVVDADIYGPSMPMMFDLEGAVPQGIDVDGKTKMKPLESYGVKLLSIGFFAQSQQAVVWRGPMASKALNQLIWDAHWGELDYLIIDLPPGTGDIHLSLVQSIPLTGAIVVSTPQPIALADARKGVNMFQMESINVPVLGIIENMAYFTPEDMPNKKYYIFGKEGAKELAEQLNIELLAEIPIVQSVREAADAGRPAILQIDSPIAKSFLTLAKNVVAVIDKRNTKIKPTQAVKTTHSRGCSN
jgi:ATP-binding protein involved in chromosome partitioning